MGQALRSTTSVSRPVDMFFLPSEAEPEIEESESDSPGTASEAQETLPIKTGRATPKRESADGPDVSRETSAPAPATTAGAGGAVSSGAATRSSPVQRDSAQESQNAKAEQAHEPVKSTTGAATKASPTSSEDGSGALSSAASGQPGGRDAGEPAARENTPEGNAALQAVPGAVFAELPVSDIHPNRKQPRQVFDEDELAELAFSVRELGVLQPIVVRPSHDGGEQSYELVMGERRWRAVQEAGMSTIPAIIRDTADNDLLRDALLENLHRAQLNPLEEAAAYQQLMEEFGATQEQLSERIGRSRPQISNTLRLLRLPALVQRRVAAGVLSSGHARALLGLSDPVEMERLAQRIVAEGLSVRATEEAVALSGGSAKTPSRRKAPATRHDDRLGYIADAFSDKLDTSVKIQLGARKGKMTIEFASVEDLNRIIDVLDPKLEPES
ncbi:ParB/RepB/Spo0J family partition protein [Kocuria sp.]|uniref:ParB/RepB/Spo0J family partition protein n=1 Tax=Kocuria sp. TaxID=1871328 RepID=UPI0026DD18C7|nr:ParB/RepB/Spo0J family partition protein [Kocuria sp.]MDO4919111.1 ParB/RepB/Spo0J family partition protein [Kocuria sp.]